MNARHEVLMKVKDESTSGLQEKLKDRGVYKDLLRTIIVQVALSYITELITFDLRASSSLWRERLQ